MTKIEGLSAGQELVLRLNTGNLPWWALATGDQWWDARGKRCSAADNCEEATQARIWLDKTKGSWKRVSGKFAVDLGGQHLEGELVVNYRKHKGPPFICE
jgi:hypothetical protein